MSKVGTSILLRVWPHDVPAGVFLVAEEGLTQEEVIAWCKEKDLNIKFTEYPGFPGIFDVNLVTNKIRWAIYIDGNCTMLNLRRFVDAAFNIGTIKILAHTIEKVTNIEIKALLMLISKPL